MGLLFFTWTVNLHPNRTMPFNYCGNVFFSVDVVSTDYWVGLYDSSGWTWVDGQTLSYTNWYSGEPNGSGDCGRMISNGEWRDKECSDNYRVICKAPASGQSNGMFTLVLIDPHIVSNSFIPEKC